ncbi:MAG: NAD(P)(+) transhydrogenase (Re/Si-specific) subunit beta, partial [Gemmatimonas sp.]
MISVAWVRLIYLVAAVLFITGLKQLQSPETARKGNRISAIGMLIAILVTLIDAGIVSYTTIAAGMVVGTALGLWLAYTVKMTSMPQMVALLNGFGGGASLLVAIAEYLNTSNRGITASVDTAISTHLGVLIGAVTLTGSLIAWAKLQEVMTGKPITFPAQKSANALMFLVIAALAAWLVMDPTAPHAAFYVLVALSLLLGVTLVIPIGGADMPVVISLLNSYSGLAGAMTGFIIHNEVLIVSGALVGSSGVILSLVMCKAMNRSLSNVIFGAFGGSSKSSGKLAEGLSVNETNIEEAALQLAYA